MTDRELSEFAAKAADISFSHIDIGTWNPLADNEDAFKLAVKLGITFRTKDGWATAGYPLKTGCEVHVAIVEDKYLSARIAITKAASIIGESMK